MGNSRWRSFRAGFRETDLWVAVDIEGYLPEAEDFVMDRIRHYRKILEDHIHEYPEFRDSLVPVMAPAGVHPLVRDMSSAAQAAGAGPMSAVAGAIAEYISNDMIDRFSLKEIIIENGGDIYLKLSAPATISIYAGSSPLSDKIGLMIKPQETPLSICCSSGTVGHSLSFGVADACMIACRSGAQADAYATAFCNMVKGKEKISEITETALQYPDILSVVIIKDDVAGIGGKLDVRVL